MTLGEIALSVIFSVWTFGALNVFIKAYKKDKNVPEIQIAITILWCLLVLALSLTAIGVYWNHTFDWNTMSLVPPPTE